MAKQPKPFREVPEAERRTLRIPVLCTAAEKAALEEAASLRSLPVAEWLRRAGMGRKADIRYDTQIVLTISQQVQALRQLHELLNELCREEGTAVDEQVVADLVLLMREAIAEAKAALLRIDK